MLITPVLKEKEAVRTSQGKKWSLSDCIWQIVYDDNNNIRVIFLWHFAHLIKILNLRSASKTLNVLPHHILVYNWKLMLHVKSHKMLLTAACQHSLLDAEINIQVLFLWNQWEIIQKISAYEAMDHIKIILRRVNQIIWVVSQHTVQLLCELPGNTLLHLDPGCWWWLPVYLFHVSE